MTDGLNRRDFLARSAMAGAGVALIGSTEMLLTTPEASAATTARPAPAAGYGALVADPAGRLALPKASRTRSSRRRVPRCWSRGSSPPATTTAPAPSRARAGARSWSTTTRSASPSAPTSPCPTSTT
ncbi:twin-arginine translocation signal domain-containing protein [Pseudonocardia sp.]|uniref:twin-arginine translocation signal domain-containing protein n=1 Tax=Pseudonocardia sp. TaxID=60912 RepID=UPI0025EFA5CD|nr:twin-arginine translocation signal domain-containing protein [Pseudonocardia sp.]